jgi:protein involved in polysaccharide export with SLBB domain
MKCIMEDNIRKLIKLAMILLCPLIAIGCSDSGTTRSISAQNNDAIITALKNLDKTVKEKNNGEKVFDSNIPIVPGDILEFKFFYTPELNEIQTVRPDGKISLQLIGEVDVWGKSPSEIRNALLSRYTPYLKNPEVTVIMRLMYNRRVYVGGEVMRPGLLEMPAKMTILEAIMLAGGFNISKAEPENVLVIRRAEGRQYSYSVNLKPVLKGQSTIPFSTSRA